MRSRLSPALPVTRPHRALAALLSVVVGSTLPAAAVLADDGGAGGMAEAPARPAAKGEGKAEAPAAKPASRGGGKSDAAASRDAKVQKNRDAEMLNDFIHYVLIDRKDLAKSMGQGLVDRGIEPREFSHLVDTSVGYNRFITAASRAGRSPDLEGVAGRLIRLYEDGKLGQARDQESIAANIKLLTGDSRQRSVARERLMFAGEYAVPQLLSTMLGSTDVRLAAEARTLLRDMKRHAVMPLAAALPALPAAHQEQVAGLLGDTGQTQALPFLYDLASTSNSEQARNAADAAIRRISGAINPAMPLADRYVDLAESFYKNNPSVISFPNDPNQLVWTFDPGAGLFFQSVDTKVFGATMAMRLSETALRRDAASERAVATWIASNFSRELRSPEGYENPVYKDKRDAMYYAVAAGPTVDERVLARALDASDTPLARRSLAALEKTGGRSAWAGGGGAGNARRPLVEALRYPSRRVQYDAALAIAAAQPREAFPGSDQVVRTLASAIRDASQKFAFVVVAGGDTNTVAELSANYADALRGAGYTVLATGPSMEAMAQAVADAPGVDLILLRQPGAIMTQTVTGVLNDPKLRATPVLAMVDAQGALENATRFSREPRVRLAREGLQRAEILAAADDLVKTASGGLIAGDEADLYKARALSALRDVAVANNPVFNLVDAQAPLLSALPEAKGQTQARIAEILSYLPTDRAQQAIFDTALNAAGQERVDLLNAATHGAKRVGNMLADRHVESLTDLVRTAQGDEATAAAALMGALNLRGPNVVPLILGSGPEAPATTQGASR